MANELNMRKGFISLQDSTVSADLTVDALIAASLTYPTSDGSANQALTTDGSGALAFQTVILDGGNISDLTNDSNFISGITAESIGDLSDVTITAGTNGDLLQFNGSAWVNVDVDSIMGAQNLEDLGDVTIASAASGDFLRYSGSAWVDSTIQNGDIAEGAVTQHEAALSITESQISDFGTYQVTSEKGQANGYASLDSGGLVPSAQLPSYVDDVEEYANEASFPATGETGKLYVDLSDNSVHRWSGSAYVNITDYSTPGHTHVAADITDFDAEVDNQIAAASIADLSDVGALGSNGQVYVSSGSALVATTLDHDNISDFDTAAAAIADTQIGAASIADLSDVGAVGTSGQVYVSDGSALVATTLDHDNISDFDSEVNALIGATNLGGLNDVTITSIASGELLQWNGSAFINQTITELGLSEDGHTHVAADVTDFDTEVDNQIAAAVWDDLSNVAVSGATTNQQAKYNGTNWVNFTSQFDESQADVSIASDGATTILTLAQSGTTAFHVDYAISDSTNMRTGTLMCITDGTTIELTDIATSMIGSEASEPEFAAAIDGANIDINVTDGAGYQTTILVRNIA